MNFIKKLSNFLYWRSRDFLQFLKNSGALLLIILRSQFPYTQKPHSQKREIVVSLTSHKSRFKTLHYTLECLLRQSIKADRILLWIDKPDEEHITPEMRKMQARGVEIITTTEYDKSFNKIIPSLKAFPDAMIVTVDDDIYYPKHMLENLLSEWSGDDKEIVCHYACKVPCNENGEKLSFKDWIPLNKNYVGYDIVAYGFAGVLYPPGSLPAEVMDRETFKKLCPRADDMWLYWMGRRNGCVYRKTNKKIVVVEWPTSQAVGLKNHNTNFGNDEQICNLVAKYGWPSFTTR